MGAKWMHSLSLQTSIQERESLAAFQHNFHFDPFYTPSAPEF